MITIAQIIVIATECIINHQFGLATQSDKHIGGWTCLNAVMMFFQRSLFLWNNFSCTTQLWYYVSCSSVSFCFSRKLFRRVTVVVPKCCHVPGYSLSATLVTIAVKRKITCVFFFRLFTWSLNYFLSC